MKKLISLALAAVLALGILSGCGKKADAAIQIAVPNDTTNEARALLLLEANGIIKLKDGAGITATKNDIAENPHNVEIVETEAAQIPNILKDVDYAVINSNYAINAGLNPVKDSLAIEGSASAYANILAVKEGNESSDKVKALVAALESQQVADYIAEKYDGAVVSTVENPGDGYDASVDYAALAGQTISVAASPTPHAEILEVAKEILAEKDITLDIQTYNDYVVPNTVVEDGTVDANYFQHTPYLDDFNKENGTHIVSVAAIHVEPIFETAGGRVEALKDISLTIPDGDVYGIIGMSGAGKSTLVRCINMLERPTSGEVIVNGKRLDTMSPAQLRAARRDITMIFQRFNLLMQRNCLDNVCFPMELAGVSRREAASRAQELLETVGLPDKAKAYPAQLSGGQQQRVAIARALATNPKVLLCDEATSALDPKTTRQILELIGDINKKLGITVVIITHQMSVVKSVCNHVAILDDGEVVEDGLVSTVFSAPKSAAARHLVFPGGADVTVSDPTQERRIRLIFRSAKTTSIPLVARLATEENIAANVISASTQKLSEEIYGSMLLGVPAAQFDRAWEFLSGIENLQVEEASVGVQ